jgi:DNA-binding MarR family transcriptional regulator
MIMEDLETEVREAVVRIYRRVKSERSDAALGDTASAVLSHLVKEGPQTLRALSERERVTPPAMNQTVNALEATGHVVRHPDPTDGRKVLISATESGVALREEARRVGNAWLHSRLGRLSEPERRTLAEAARIMKDVAES